MPSYISGRNAAVKNLCIRNNVNMMSIIHSSELLDRKMSYTYLCKALCSLLTFPRVFLVWLKSIYTSMAVIIPYETSI